MYVLQKRLDRGDTIVMDGGTGTEIEKRGGAVNGAAWSAESLLTHPDIVRDVHRDFIHAGAEIIIANSFSTSRHLLEAAHLEDHFEEMNRRAVELAIAARDSAAEDPVADADRPLVKHTVTVAGSISTTTMGQDQPLPDVARRNFADQARILAGAGAEFIILEMMRDVEYTGYALEGALETGLPVWVGFSVERGKEDQLVLVDGKTPLADGIGSIDPRAVQAVGIMHTLTELIDDTLTVLKRHWSGPSCVYAHSGFFEMPNWRFVDVSSPEEYADDALRWVRRGVQVIGGCCGIGPEHIRVLREKLSPNAL